MLRLHNTLTRETEDFKPIKKGIVGMYACGITPYDDSHIGHARSAVVFDVLYRTLLLNFRSVTYVRNITDIDDKIINRAKELGEEPATLTKRFIDSYHADMAELMVLAPTYEPKVSENLAGIVEMIDELLEKEFAYATPSGDVMYRVSKFPRFGGLAMRNLTEEQHGARVEIDPEKEAPEDFVLWKANAKSATKLEHAFEPSAFGAKNFDAPGRPGWHIECSAMSKDLLKHPFDIHGGGEDLVFPHHSCEIAQSEALLRKGKKMANYWVHNAFITVGGKKMSKSLGNFTTIKDALVKYDGAAIRLWLLQTHYRKPVDYSDEALQAAQNALNRLYDTVRAWPKAENAKGKPSIDASELVGDDLDTSNLLRALWNVVDDPAISSEEKSRLALEMDKILGLGLEDVIGVPVEIPTEVEEMVKAREAARKAKNWKESDRLRDEIASHGFVVEDGPKGPVVKKS